VARKRREVREYWEDTREKSKTSKSRREEKGDNIGREKEEEMK